MMVRVDRISMLALFALVVSATAQDCVYSSWTEWSSCGATCINPDESQPTQTRSRTLTVGPAVNCTALVETGNCSLPNCPYDPELETLEGNILMKVVNGKDVYVKVGDGASVGINDLANDVDALDSELEGHKAASLMRADSLAERLDGHDTDIADLSDLVDQTEASLAIVIDEDLAELSTAFSADIDALERTSRDVDAVCTASEAACSASEMTQRVLAQSAALDALEARVAQLEAFASRVESTAASTKATADNVKNAANSQSSLATATAAVVALEVDGLTQLSTQASTNFAAVGVAQSTPSLSRLEMRARIAELKEKLDDYENPNVKECVYVHMNNGCETCTLMTCYFDKKFDHTVVRLTFSGNMRYISTGYRAHWWLQVDGKPCIPHDPNVSRGGGIDASLHMTSNQDQHRMATIAGFCDKLAGNQPIGKGRHQVQLRLQTDAGDAYTGWASASRIIIEEFPPGTHRVCSASQKDCG
jgi:hypothetical protein